MRSTPCTGVPYPCSLSRATLARRSEPVIGAPGHQELDAARPHQRRHRPGAVFATKINSMMTGLLRRRDGAVINGASVKTRGGTDGPISTGTNAAILVSLTCKALCATLTAGSHEGRPCEPSRKQWLRARACCN